MFKATITTTPFTTEAANGFFQDTITGEAFRTDNSFLATLRALVAPRLPKGESVHLQFGSSRYSASDVSSASVENVVRTLLNNVDTEQNGLFYIHNFTNTSENNMASMACVEKKLTAVYPQYSRLEAITAFYRKTFNVDCFISIEHKSVLVFVDNLDNRKLHYLQCSILAMLPWYFNKEIGVTAKEMELIKSLRETSADNYLMFLSELAKQYDFKTARIRQLLSGFETRYEQLEIERVRRKLQDIESQINYLNAQIGEQLGLLNDQQIKYMGLDRRIHEASGEDSEIMEYFLCNNKLTLESVNNTEMSFVVKDYVTYFDRDVIERMICNRRSMAYRYCGSAYDLDKVEKLLRELFIVDTPRLRIKTCAAYSFNLTGNVTGLSQYSFGAEFKDAIPNMHIQRHSCMSAYGRVVNELLRERNYIGAIEQCVASCKSLNPGDGIVMEEFFKEFYSGSSYTNRCIELPDGRTVKPLEAIQWLDEQEVQHGQEEAREEQAHE